MSPKWPIEEGQRPPENPDDALANRPAPSTPTAPSTPNSVSRNTQTPTVYRQQAGYVSPAELDTWLNKCFRRGWRLYYGPHAVRRLVGGTVMMSFFVIMEIPVSCDDDEPAASEEDPEQLHESDPL